MGASNAQGFQKILQLMASAMEEPLLDEWLIQHIPCDLDEADQIKDIIIEVENDELGHNQMFKTIYKQLTGEEVPQVEEKSFEAPASFKKGIEKALKEKLRTVKDYREIMAGLPNNIYREQVLSSLTDELAHANYYNYVYSLVMSHNK